MIKKYLVLLIILIISTSCTGKADIYREPSGEIVINRSIDIQYVQIHQSQILPPYGDKVTAEVASLKLRISSSHDESAGKLNDIQNAIDHIKSLAEESEILTFEGITVGQVGGSYGREISEYSISEYQFEYLESTSIIIKLSTKLNEHNMEFMNVVSAFNDFVNRIELDDTAMFEIVSIGTDLGDLETIRQNLISQVYSELNSIQNQYDNEVKYEITGLYDSLKMIKLSDIEYYVYIDPIVVVSEF